MYSHSTFQKTCLTALLLAGSCCAMAEPAATPNPAQHSPAVAQVTAPAGPATQPAAATGPAGDPAAAVPPAGMTGNAAALAGAAARMSDPQDTGAETAGMPAPAGETDVGEEAGAGPDDPAAAVAAIDPETIYGDWTVKEQHPDAGEVVTLFSINADNSFAGTMTVAGNVVWTYSGSWYLDGNQITWFYNSSTPPLALADETEVDEIVSVDGEKLIYRSGKRDVLETLYRASD